MLKCDECGSRSTKIVSRKELREISKRPNPFMSSAISPLQIYAILEIIRMILKKSFKENEDFIYCENCGHCRKLDEEED